MEISGAPDPGLIPDTNAPHENDWYNRRDFDGYRYASCNLAPKPIVLIVRQDIGASLIHKAKTTYCVRWSRRSWTAARI